MSVEYCRCGWAFRRICDNPKCPVSSASERRPEVSEHHFRLYLLAIETGLASHREAMRHGIGIAERPEKNLGFYERCAEQADLALTTWLSARVAHP